MAGFGRLIRDARESARLSQEDLADAMGVSRSLVGAFETERAGISPDMFVKLCMALENLSPVKLVEAIGYPVQMPSEEKIPPKLAKMMVRLEAEDLLVVERLVRGLLSESERRSE